MRLNEIGARYVQLDDRRRICCTECGDPGGAPVFYFHGMPGSRLEAQFGHQAAADHGCRLIGLDRPAIGRSDFCEGRSLLDCPRDVEEMARQFEIDRFGLIGLSGGGPYALACGQLTSDRLAFTVLMGSRGPVADQPAHWSDVAPLDRFFGKLSKRAPWAFYVAFWFIGFAAHRLSAQAFVRANASSMSEADKELMRNDALACLFAEDMRDVSPGRSRTGRRPGDPIPRMGTRLGGGEHPGAPVPRRT